MQFSSREHPAIVAAARYALPGITANDPVSLKREDVHEVNDFCRSDRISGLMASAIHAGHITVDADRNDGQAQSVPERDWHDALHACVLLEALLVRVASLLDDVGIRWLVTKGPALAHLDYGDPALRTFADIDVIIHPDDWDRAVDLLAPESTANRWYHDYVVRYGKGVTALVDGMEVDLHLRFAVGRFGARCRTTECFIETNVIVLGGRDIPVPSAAYRMLHACFHASLGGNRELRAFRDVAQLALGKPDDLDQAWQIAERWRVQAVMATALIEAWKRLGLPADHPVLVNAQRIRIDAGDRRALDVFAREEPFRQQAMTTLGELPWGDRLRFAYTSWMMGREHRR